MSVLMNIRNEVRPDVTVSKEDDLDEDLKRHLLARAIGRIKRGRKKDKDTKPPCLRRKGEVSIPQLDDTFYPNMFRRMVPGLDMRPAFEDLVFSAAHPLERTGAVKIPRFRVVRILEEDVVLRGELPETHVFDPSEFLYQATFIALNHPKGARRDNLIEHFERNHHFFYVFGFGLQIVRVSFEWYRPHETWIIDAKRPGEARLRGLALLYASAQPMPFVL